MITASMGVGLALIALGIWGYSTAQTPSPTALIPAAFGAVLLLCGVMARDAAKLKTWMHIAAVVGVLGFLGGLPGLLKIGDVLSGAEVGRPNAVISQAILSVLCLFFTILCIRSFKAARSARKVA